MKTREDALSLLYSWVESESLRRHCLGVAFCMEAYAEKFGEDKDKFWISGLLHDFDWEKYPNINEHPKRGCQELKAQGYDEEIINAILGHNEVTGVSRHSILSKTLFAVDELSGLVVATAKVRPNNFEGMTYESVEKAIKKKDFAAAINRESIEKGIIELGVNRKEHFEMIISALKDKKRELGFN